MSHDANSANVFLFKGTNRGLNQESKKIPSPSKNDALHRQIDIKVDLLNDKIFKEAQTLKDS